MSCEVVPRKLGGSTRDSMQSARKPRFFIFFDPNPRRRLDGSGLVTRFGDDLHETESRPIADRTGRPTTHRDSPEFLPLFRRFWGLQVGAWAEFSVAKSRSASIELGRSFHAISWCMKTPVILWWKEVNGSCWTTLDTGLQLPSLPRLGFCAKRRGRTPHTIGPAELPTNRKLEETPLQ